jgi:dihydroxyacetone kinase
MLGANDEVAVMVNSLGATPKNMHTLPKSPSDSQWKDIQINRCLSEDLQR